METIRHWRTGRKLTVAHSRSGIRVTGSPSDNLVRGPQPVWPTPSCSRSTDANDRFRGGRRGRRLRQIGAGAYCDLQSPNSEDAATFSFFGVLGGLTDEERRETTDDLRAPRPSIPGRPRQDLGVAPPAAPREGRLDRRPRDRLRPPLGGHARLGRVQMELAVGASQGVNRDWTQLDLRLAVLRGARPQGVARSPPVGRSRRRQAPGLLSAPERGAGIMVVTCAGRTCRSCFPHLSAPNSKTTYHGRVNSRLQARNIVRSRRACSDRGHHQQQAVPLGSAEVLRRRLQTIPRVRRALRLLPSRVPSRRRAGIPVRPAPRDAVRHPHRLGHAPHGRRRQDEDEADGMGPIPRIVGERRSAPDFLASRHPARIVRTRATRNRYRPCGPATGRCACPSRTRRSW